MLESLRQPQSVDRAPFARAISQRAFQRPLRLTLPAGVAAWLLLTGLALAQHGHQAHIVTPFHQVSDSFFEQIGVNFNFHVGNFFFQQNGAGAALPPFGGGAPGAGMHTGFSVHAPGGIDATFNIVAAQGSSASMVSQTPSVTVPNGIQGGIFDASLTPFVIGVVPVVGDGGMAPGISPLKERLERLKEGGAAAYGPRDKAVPTGQPQPVAAPVAVDAAGPRAEEQRAAAVATSASQPPQASVAQLRQVHAAAEAAQQQAVLALVDKARQAEAAGKPGQARIFYRQAASRAASPLKEQLLSRAAQLAATVAKPNRPR